MNETDLLALRETISRQLQEETSSLLVAIAGAPASGKSTQAALLSRQLNENHASSENTGQISIVVPMDGFHLDNRVLEREGLLSRKGSPATFDAIGLLHMLERIKQMDTPQSSGSDATTTDSFIAFPVFDRELDLSKAAADRVLPEHRCIIVEGNYLLLEQQPWALLRELFDITVMLDVPEETLSERLTARWLSHGETLEKARSRAEYNDLPNARTVISYSSKADFIIRNG